MSKAKVLVRIYLDPDQYDYLKNTAGEIPVSAWIRGAIERRLRGDNATETKKEDQVSRV